MENYDHLQVIGKGSYGVVSKIRRKSDGKILVWKEVNYGHMSEKEKQLIVTEVNLLRELRHPYIVRYLDRIIDKPRAKIYIIMEYCEGGDLGQFIKLNKRKGTYVNESFIWRVFAHVFLALKECHRRTTAGTVKPILHRDIKPGNIFLDAQWNAKLGDFGLAKELCSSTRFAQTNVGTPYYQSPEMVNEMQYDERSDIWALGCLLYELAALKPPFDATNQLALAKKIDMGKFERIPEHYSESLFQVIRWMLHRQRSRRPRIEDLERLPQFANLLKEQEVGVTEHQMQSSYSTKVKELRALEESLKQKQIALDARETRIKEQEVIIYRREQEVLMKEKRLLREYPSPLSPEADENILQNQYNRRNSSANRSPTESVLTSPTCYSTSTKSSAGSPPRDQGNQLSSDARNLYLRDHRYEIPRNNNDYLQHDPAVRSSSYIGHRRQSTPQTR